MTDLLKISLVKYQCSCSIWLPLSQLHFCRKCSQLKCPLCLNEEIDIIFCPNCMENNSSSDASQRKFRCNICNECPLCGNLLVVRSQNDFFYLICNSCQWTSRDSGIADRRTSVEWPDQWNEQANPMEGELNKVLTLMKGLSNYEKLERERQTQASKRLSSLGVLPNDRYGLQTAYNLRKKALSSRPDSTEKLDQLSASFDVPDLDPEIFTKPVDSSQVPTLAQILNHPITGPHGQLFPTKTKMINRRSFRCVESDMILYKGEYAPSVVKPRLQNFGMDNFPEIRILREVKLIPGKTSSFFLSVTNGSTFAMNVVLKGVFVENDMNCVDTSDFSLEFSLHHKESSLDTIEEEYQTKYLHATRSFDSTDLATPGSQVLYIRRHRAGICVDCVPNVGISEKDGYALFRMDFSNSEDSPNHTLSANVKVHLQFQRPEE